MKVPGIHFEVDGSTSGKRVLLILMMFLAATGAVTMQANAQPASASGANISRDRGEGGDARDLRQKIEALRQEDAKLRATLQPLEAKAKPVYDQIRQLEAQIKPLRDQARSIQMRAKPIEEQMRENYKKIQYLESRLRHLREERRENREERQFETK